MKIFLSYSDSDKKDVKRIYDSLNSHGHKLWFDKKKIIYGGNIVDQIGQGLEEADVVIVFLSEKSILSTWVKKEWEIAFFEHVNRGDVYIIPLLLENCEIPKLLRDKKQADFSDKEKYETNLANLLRSLEIIECNNNEERTKNYTAESVFDYTKELLDELEGECISLPVHKRLPSVPM